MNNYKPYEYKGKTMLIESFVILHQQHCSQEDYDIFDLKLDTHVKDLLSQQPDLSDYKVFDDQDREFFNTFRFIENSQNKKYYLYTSIYSKTNTKIIVYVKAKKGKLWINGKCISVHTGNGLSRYYLTVKLNKGVNHLIFEHFCFDQDSRFCIQIRNYKREMANHFQSLSQVSYSVSLDPFVLIQDPTYLPHQSRYRFMYFKNNDEEYQKDYKVKIYDSVVGFVKEQPARLNEVVEIDVDELRALDEEILRHENIICVIKTRKNTELQKSSRLILNDYTQKAKPIADELLKLAREQSPEVYEHAMGKVQRLYDNIENGYYGSGYLSISLCQIMISNIKKQKMKGYYYNNSGNRVNYIYSKLDNSYGRIEYRVPSGYSQEKKYPAFIILSTSNVGSFSSQMPAEKDLNEPCLFFDVTGRGCTAGSYIGEASFFEIFNWIKENFSVDEDRVYLLGYSNGGFATYGIAQNHPDLSAAIFPFAGYPQIATIKNTCNLPTYQIVGSKDHVFFERKNEVKKLIKGYGNYYQYDFNEENHHTIAPYFCHKKIINDILKNVRNKYPKSIYFKTFRNRHLKSFWVELRGIEKGRSSATVKAEITDSKTIHLHVMGASGITITLPPQINRTQFDIIINKNRFSFEKYAGDKISFEKKGTWRRTEKAAVIDVCKGTGLLDVYLKALKIILPENASETLRNTARNFAQPDTNGYTPRVAVNYPVHTESDIPKHVFDYSMIVFDNCNSSDFAKRFWDMLPVKYHEKGFVYKNKTYEKDYVIMQVIANPYDINSSILFISTNNEEMLKRHILLRKVIIPTYLNGIHSYWNNEILIYDGKEYSAVYEQNGMLKPIKR